MKIFLTLLFSVLSVSAQMPMALGVASKAAAVQAGPTYLISENCDTAAPNNWTSAGSTVTWNDTTTPQPLVSGGGITIVGTTASTYSNFTAQTHCYSFCAVRVASSLTANPRLMSFGPATIRFSSSKLRVIGSGYAFDYGDSTGTFLADTTYYLWVEYQQSSNPNVGQGDGYVKAWLSTTTTKPGSPTAQFLNSTNTATASRITFTPATAGSTTVYWDKVRVDDADIGSDPQ